MTAHELTDAARELVRWFAEERLGWIRHDCGGSQCDIDSWLDSGGAYWDKHDLLGWPGFGIAVEEARKAEVEWTAGGYDDRGVEVSMLGYNAAPPWHSYTRTDPALAAYAALRDALGGGNEQGMGRPAGARIPKTPAGQRGEGQSPGTIVPYDADDLCGEGYMIGTRSMYYIDDKATLYQGDVREVLRTLPAESVQTVVTSPPYWSLRDYGIAPSVWGGDADCAHAWGPMERGKRADLLPADVTTSTGRIGTDDRQGHASLNGGHYCQCCGAWRGALGLEPTPALFVAHMVEVFREVWRVLRKDGTAWVNLGSSYASGDSGPSPSLSPAHVPAYGNGDTEPSGSRGSGSAYRDLCGECLVDYLNHQRSTLGTRPPLALGPRPASPIARDIEHSGSVEEPHAASLPAAQESTTLESWLRLRGACSRCATREDALLELGSDVADVLVSAHTVERTNGRGNRGKAGRKTGTDASVLAWEQYTSTFKPKDMVPIPWMVAMALQADGWYLRQDIIWAKPNPMPESVRDRCTKAHEYVFLLSKSPRYFWDQDAIREAAEKTGTLAHLAGGNGIRAGSRDGLRREEWRARKSIVLGSQAPTESGVSGEPTSGRNKRSVWTVATDPFPEAHFATFPPALIAPMILAGAPVDGTVLDPFVGSGTTAIEAKRLGRRAIGIDLNTEYLDMAVRGLQLNRRPGASAETNEAQAALWAAE